MRNFIAGLIALLLISIVWAAPVQAGTSMGEDSFQECSYPPLADLWVMRPVGMLGLGFGSVMFGLSAPFTAVFATSQFGDVFSDLVGKPAHFIFVRPLGECVAQKQA